VVGTGYRPPGLIQLGIERRTPPPLPLPAPLSTDEKLKALVGAFATMAGYGLTFVALLLAGLSGWVGCDQYLLLRSWSRADAEIVNSELYSQVLRVGPRTQSPPKPIFGFRCTVRFQANGRLYESQADIGYEKSAKSEMIDWYLRFPSGSHTTIAYDPANPNRVKLAENFETAYAGALTTLGYAGWLFLFGFPLVLVSRRLRRQGQSTLDQDFPLQPDFG
jgi:Protein of unknown function (DUF3592)